MGLACSRQLPESPIAPATFFLICDSSFKILDASVQFEKMLNISLGVVLNQSVGLIMDQFVGFLFRNQLEFISEVIVCQEDSRNFKLRLNESNKNIFTIYELNGRAIYMDIRATECTRSDLAAIYGKSNTLQMVKYKNNSDILGQKNLILLQFNEHISSDGVSRIKTFRALNNASMFQTESQGTGVKNMMTRNEVVVICLDIAQLREATEVKLAYISEHFYNDLTSVVRNYFYPYFYFVESSGDRFSIVVNADWTKDISNHCALQSLYFIEKFAKEVCSYTSLKMGLSFGNILYSRKGNDIRLYGDVINLAARLEQASEGGEVLLSGPFREKLLRELASLRISRQSSLLGTLQFGGNSTSSIQTDLLSPKGDESFDHAKLNNDVTKSNIVNLHSQDCENKGEEKKSSFVESEIKSEADFQSCMDRCTRKLRRIGDVDCYVFQVERLNAMFRFLFESY